MRETHIDGHDLVTHDEPVIDRITLEGALSELPAQFRAVSMRCTRSI
ncbi:MAG TPA: hypothetical protein VK864_02435 [Longimicrobiales bacterium]|nr:hypothetical protein [Longimicrobiales bacterium]